MLHERKSTLSEMRAQAESQALMSSNADQAWPGRVGGELRAAREALGWKLADVAASLRIREPYLEALEAGRNDELPGLAYAVGFVRAYAALLHLDPVETTRRFRAESGEAGRRPTLDFPAPVPEAGVPAGAMALLGVVLVAFAYIGWYYVSGDRPSTQVVQQVPDRLAPLAQTAMSSPTAAPGTGVPASPTQAMPGQAVPVQTQASPSQAPAASVPATQPVPAPAANPATAAAAPLPTTAVAPAAAAGSGIVLGAHADTWVQVRDPAVNKVIYNHVLHAGETWQVPTTPGLLLTVGNAGGLDITVDGSPAPAIGAIGGVRRDIPLDPQLIKDGKLPPPPKPKPKPKAPDPTTDTAATASGSDE